MDKLIFGFTDAKSCRSFPPRNPVVMPGQVQWHKSPLEHPPAPVLTVPLAPLRTEVQGWRPEHPWLHGQAVWLHS